MSENESIKKAKLRSKQYYKENDIKRIFRTVHDKENYYTMISDQILKSDLGIVSKGLLCEVLSQADNYFFHPTVFYEKYGRKTIDKAIKELIEKGYCNKRKVSAFITEFQFYECPTDVLTVHREDSNDVPNEDLRCTQSTPNNYHNNNHNHHIISRCTIGTPYENQEKSNQNQNNQLHKSGYDLDNNKVEIREFPKEILKDSKEEINQGHNKVNTIQEQENNNKMNKIFSVKNGVLIKEALNDLFKEKGETFNQSILDKWYKWKLSKEKNVDKCYSLETYYKSFKSFNETDKKRPQTNDQPQQVGEVRKSIINDYRQATARLQTITDLELDQFAKSKGFPTWNSLPENFRVYYSNPVKLFEGYFIKEYIKSKPETVRSTPVEYYNDGLILKFINQLRDWLDKGYLIYNANIYEKTS